MTTFLAAIGVFLLTHMLPAVRPLRTFLVQRLGTRTYIAVFSIISILVVIWLGWAYREAPYHELWPDQDWARLTVLIVMPLACVLIVAGLASANPFSLSLAARPFDPARPGIVALVRHPAILGLGLWSAAHILVNGDQASVLLFGLLTALGVAGPFSLAARRRRAMGEEAWQKLKDEAAKTTRLQAFFQIGLRGWVGGLCLYGALLYFHERVIGVPAYGG